MSKQIIVFFFIIFNTISFYGQTNSPQENYYKWFDAIVGVENTGIYNGVEYKKKYRTLDGNNEFYSTYKFMQGDIVYDQQSYYDVEMNYDVYEDEVIVKLYTQSTFNTIQIIKEKVESFFINNILFIRIYNEKNDDSFGVKEGFYEVLFQDNYVSLYKKHIKRRIERLDKDFMYYVFKDKEAYFLKYNQKYYKIKSKSDFSKIFPELKKSINSFNKKNKAIRKSDYDMFLNKLSEHIEALITINKVSN